MAVDLICMGMSLPLRTGRRYGQILEARQVPHAGFGLDEGPPNFFCVHVTDRNWKDVIGLAGWQEELEDKGLTLEGFVIRAGGRVDPNRLETKIRDELYAKGEITLTWKELEPAVMDDMTEARRRYVAGDAVWPTRITIEKVVAVADDVRKDH